MTAGAEPRPTRAAADSHETAASMDREAARPPARPPARIPAPARPPLAAGAARCPATALPPALPPLCALFPPRTAAESGGAAPGDRAGSGGGAPGGGGEEARSDPERGAPHLPCPVGPARRGAARVH